MTDVLKVHLLGSPDLRLGATPLRFRRHKTLALLAYLILTGRPAVRESLAALLADLDVTSEQLALQSLRASVAELRDQLADYLVVSRQAVALDPAAPCWADVHEFQRLLTSADADAPAVLAQAAELYAGDLLAGFSLRGAPGYEAWLAGERVRLRDLAAQVWHKQLEAATAVGDHVMGLAAAERLIAGSPTAESTYRRIMALLAAQGEHEQALQFYERCRAALAEQRGVAPAPETTALYERISGERTPAAASPLVRRAGIVPADDELALLVERLAAPECRLVTLLSATPEAATALAMRAVTQFLIADETLLPFPNGVYVTSAAGSAHSLAEMIRQVIAEGSSEQSASIDLLLDHLAPAGMLLVLDGLTPTDAEIALVAAILRRAPRVTLLVAARQRLLLQEEWVLDVGEAQQVGWRG